MLQRDMRGKQLCLATENAEEVLKMRLPRGELGFARHKQSKWFSVSLFLCCTPFSQISKSKLRP